MIQLFSFCLTAKTCSHRIEAVVDQITYIITKYSMLDSFIYATGV